MLRPLTLIVLALLSGANAYATNPTASNSGPIAITSDDCFVWVVNRDNNSISVIKVAGDANIKIADIKVGTEPRCVAITPDDKKVFVTNMVDGTVSVIDAKKMCVTHTIDVGTEPFGCAVTPDGRKLYVANFGSDDVSVISTRFELVIKTIKKKVGPKPRGIAITGPSHRFGDIKDEIIEFLRELRDDGRDDDNDKDGHGRDKTKVYVTQFLAQLRDDARPVDQKEGSDDGKDGRVTVISAERNKVIGTVILNPLENTGFNSNGSTLDHITVPPAAPASFITGAFPNLLQSIVIAGNRAYLPNTASSPNGPFNFNVNVQGFLSVFDTGTDTDSGQTINMNSGVQNEPLGVTRLFITNPIAIAFKSDVKEGWVVSAATNRIIRVELDGNGTPTINAPPDANTPSGIVRVEVGLNPQGIVLNSKGTRAYVENFISRDVSVVDISSPTPKEIARIESADLPTTTLDLQIHRGHELFNTSIGPAGDGASAPPGGRMSNAGWGSCYSCHPDGLHDGVTWMFPDGPRQSISMESTFAHPQPTPGTVLTNGAPTAPSSDQRVLNWSAVRDEVQDFTRNIRLVSGGEGLIVGAAITDVPDLQPVANGGRSTDLDNIAAYIAFGIRAPISPLQNAFLQAGHIVRGRQLFAAASCQSCHGGVKWTTSRVDFAPPPLTPPEVITAGQLVRFLKQVGTFDPNAFNEFRAQAGTQVLDLPANGALGFNIPSLLSVFAGAPYLHSGGAPTLKEVLENVTHRSAGTAGVDTLTDPAAREDVVTFLKSIDSNSQIFPLP
jgi:YVTN family beta-propeller protein